MKNTYRQYDNSTAIDLVTSALKTAGVNYTMEYRQCTPRKVVVNFRFTDYVIPELGGLMPQISLVNSTDKSSAFKLIGGVFRLICSNGLVAGELFDNVRIIHRVGPTFERKITELPDRIVALIDQIIGAATEFQTMAATKLTEEQMIDVTASLTMSRKAKKAALEFITMPERRREADQSNSLWSLFNITNECLRKHSSKNAYEKHNKELLTNIELLLAA